MGAKDGGAAQDVLYKFEKQMVLCTVWKNSRISTGAKLRIIRNNVKLVLLYGSETWKEMKTVTLRLQTFVNRCLLRILNTCWPEVISNEELWRRKKDAEVPRKSKKGN